MPASIGKQFQVSEERYAVNYSQETGVWRILDTWHPEVEKILDWDQEIPDGNPAVTVVTDAAFTSLMREAARIGMLEQISRKDAVNRPDSEELQRLINENERLAFEGIGMIKEIEELKGKSIRLESRPVRSESFELKNNIVNSLLRLAVAEDLNETQ